MFILSGDEHQLMPNENRVIFRLQNENGRWNRESYVMRNAQHEEFKHFGMDLEFLLRQTPKWRLVLQNILFKEGDIVEHGEEAEGDNG